VGTFVNGVVHGFGTFYKKDGKKVIGKWRKGILVKTLG